jgi:hypothetical protein
MKEVFTIPGTEATANMGNHQFTSNAIWIWLAYFKTATGYRHNLT